MFYNVVNGGNALYSHSDINMVKRWMTALKQRINILASMNGSVYTDKQFYDKYKITTSADRMEYDLRFGEQLPVHYQLYVGNDLLKVLSSLVNKGDMQNRVAEMCGRLGDLRAVYVSTKDGLSVYGHFGEWNNSIPYYITGKELPVKDWDYTYAPYMIELYKKSYPNLFD